MTNIFNNSQTQGGGIFNTQPNTGASSIFGGGQGTQGTGGGNIFGQGTSTGGNVFGQNTTGGGGNIFGQGTGGGGNIFGQNTQQPTNNIFGGGQPTGNPNMFSQPQQPNTGAGLWGGAVSNLVSTVQNPILGNQYQQQMMLQQQNP